MCNCKCAARRRQPPAVTLGAFLVVPKAFYLHSSVAPDSLGHAPRARGQVIRNPLRGRGRSRLASTFSQLTSSAVGFCRAAICIFFADGRGGLREGSRVADLGTYSTFRVTVRLEEAKSKRLDDGQLEEVGSARHQCDASDRLYVAVKLPGLRIPPK